MPCTVTGIRDSVSSLIFDDLAVEWIIISQRGEITKKAE